ncbi:MAG: hypothetical protein ACOVSW_24910 [Candidatus Kapaibacteriota bacterium]
MAKAKKMWVFAPQKASPAQLSDQEKRAIEDIGEKIVQQWTKKLPPNRENPNFGWVTGYSTKWYRHFFYIMQEMQYPANKGFIKENASHNHARIEYVGGGRYAVAYFRHTGQWHTLVDDLSLDTLEKFIATHDMFIYF